ncbi:MAG: ABC transporter permease [Acidimicrobiales bacterium]
MALSILTLLVFLLPRARPGDPVGNLVDAGDADPEYVAQARAAAERSLGLDRPLPEQFGRFVADLAHGNLGFSAGNSRPVSALLRQTLPWTVLLMGTSLVLSSFLSYRIGVAAAWRRGTVGDRAITVGSTLLHAIPDYALAMVFLVLFAVRIRLFPIVGASTPFTQSASGLYKLGDVANHLVLPVAALTLGLMGTKFLLVRNATISALGQDYMVLARAKGLPERLLKRRHAGRNALLPFLNLVGIQVGIAFGGATFVQTVFGYPGVGPLMVAAVRGADYAVLQGCFLVAAVLVLTANLVVDLVAVGVDPRVGAR